MSEKTKGMIFTVASAVLFGAMPLFAKNIYAAGANAFTLVFLRFFLAVPVLFVLARCKTNIALTRKEFKQLLTLSVGFFLTPVLLFSSYNFISTGAATTIHFVYPACVLAGCALFLRQKVTPVRIGAGVLSMLGIFMFYEGGAQAGLAGIVLSFLSGVTYAFYIIYLDCSGLNTLHPFKLAFYLSSISAAVVFAGTALAGQLSFPKTAVGWGLSVVFSLMLSVGAIVLFQSGLKRVGAQKASILSTFEPITSIIVGFFVFLEPFHLKTAVGIALVLLSVILISACDKEPQCDAPKEQEPDCNEAV